MLLSNVYVSFPRFRDHTMVFVHTLRCHASQLGELEITDLEERLRERCRTMAEGEDFELAEAFHREIIAY